VHRGWSTRPHVCHWVTRQSERTRTTVNCGDVHCTVHSPVEIFAEFTAEHSAASLQVCRRERKCCHGASGNLQWQEGVWLAEGVSEASRHCHEPWSTRFAMHVRAGGGRARPSWPLGPWSRRPTKLAARTVVTSPDQAGRSDRGHVARPSWPLRTWSRRHRRQGGCRAACRCAPPPAPRRP